MHRLLQASDPLVDLWLFHTIAIVFLTAYSWCLAQTTPFIYDRIIGFWTRVFCFNKYILRIVPRSRGLVYQWTLL